VVVAGRLFSAGRGGAEGGVVDEEAPAAVGLAAGDLAAGTRERSAVAGEGGRHQRVVAVDDHLAGAAVEAVDRGDEAGQHRAQGLLVLQPAAVQAQRQRLGLVERHQRVDILVVDPFHEQFVQVFRAPCVCHGGTVAGPAGAPVPRG
jgi:hypothetical protein